MTTAKPTRVRKYLPLGSYDNMTQDQLRAEFMRVYKTLSLVDQDNVRAFVRARIAKRKSKKG